MSDRPLGAWMKLYADFTQRKAHYTDRQFRALVCVLTDAIPGRGLLPPRRALSATYGSKIIDFLFDEGDLAEVEGEVVVVGWEVYQARSDTTNAERQQRWRDKQRAARDVTRDVTPHHALSPTSTSNVTSTSTEDDEPPARAHEDGFDAEAWGQLTHAAERLVGQAYALTSPYNRLGQMALQQAADFGVESVIAAWNTSAAAAATSARPTIGQVVIGADNYLRPIPKVKPPPTEDDPGVVDLHRRLEAARRKH